MIIEVEVSFSKNKNNFYSDVERLKEGKFLVYVKSPPKNRKANKELIYKIAKYFKKKESDIKIISNTRGRKKKILIKDENKK